MMTNEAFINEIIAQYAKARTLTFGDAGYNIRRGKSHSIAGIAEDLFATLIAQKLKDKNLLFLVNKVFSVRIPGVKRAKSFQPDIAIVKNNVLTHIFEIKMDLGWNRNPKQYLIEKNNFIQQMKDHALKPWFHKTDEVPIEVSKNLAIQVVVLSGKNIGQKKLDRIQLDIEPLENIELYILSNGMHLNFYREEERKDVIIEHTEFDRLYQDTMTYLP
ncbi:hypothetical protein [Phaeodactylibacter xiamenensis]|uniref:hypothetical protein n=1 Tax=Phaeodactylibacter xiamenensis TaxID=1524460 RepID=UPI0024A8562F|nr:hypothetical protein [Phaeodactylibacter xiamenensis]